MDDLVRKTIQHYKIIEKLGAGGMGVVYLAEDLNLERKVAIKFLPHHISNNSEEKARFKIEAKAAASLNHPNIATIYSIEENNDNIFIVMEYIEGKELKNIVRTWHAPSLRIDDVINYAIQIAEGLKAAHKKGIIHRDIKSKNIMITNDGIVKIMDFGLAKIKGGTEVTKAGSTLGTIAYMSPEQSQGNEIDQRTDIWSFGVVFFEMLTGELPFKGNYDQAVIYSILNEEPASIISLKDGAPIKLEHLIRKALIKDPDKRYQNMEELVEELKEIKNKKETKSAEKTIAILPFKNISPEKETDYFADGLAEELMINLSKLKDVKVMARANTLQYRETNKDLKTIGRELGVQYLMVGSVRKFKDDLRISVQLIETQQGIQMWGETYKGKLADVFDIQENVSKEIADALMLKLSPVEKINLTKRPTLNTEAYDYYLKGRNFLSSRTKSNLDFAILLFEKAVVLDSRFAHAYAALGEAYATMYRDFDRAETWLDKALEVSLKSLMYDSSLSEAYTSLGLAYFGKNQLDEALSATKKAIELDSNNENAYWILSRIYHTADRDRDAVEALERAIAINPEFLIAYSDIQMYYERLGEHNKYRQTLEAIVKISPEYIIKYPEDTYRRMGYAMALAELGDITKAKQESEKAMELSPNDPVMMYYGACMHARFGEKREAVKLMISAVNNGYVNFEWIKRDPDLENIKNEPEFIELMKGK